MKVSLVIQNVLFAVNNIFQQNITYFKSDI